jgi:hypothetical protein
MPSQPGEPGEPGEPDDRPSLEMPSLSLRRRKKAAPEPATVLEEPVVEEPVVEGPVVEEPVVEEPAVEESVAQPAVEAPAAVGPEPVEPRVRRELPAVPGLAAAIGTGVVVGLLAVSLTLLAGVGCDAVRGTSSCGGAIGFPTLVVVLALMAWSGTALLRALRVDDAGSTSLLAVGVLAVLVMVFLLGLLDQWWTAVSVPVLAALSYAGSWLLTQSVAGDDEDAPASYDVR